MIAMSHRALRPYPMCIAFAALSSAARAQAPLHLESDVGWSHGSVSNAALDARLAAAALQYRSYAPIPRIAFFDLAYPKDSAEAAAMNGYAVLVVTAVVQDSTELPLPQVYVRSVNGDRELPLVARIASWLPASDTIVRPTFGRFRLDACYLLPIAARASQGDLLVDFATHRQGFRLIHFAGDGLPRELRAAPGSGGTGDRTPRGPTGICPPQLAADPCAPMAQRQGTEPARVSGHAANDVAGRREPAARPDSALC